MAKHHPDLIFCRKQAGVAIGNVQNILFMFMFTDLFQAACVRNVMENVSFVTRM